MRAPTFPRPEGKPTFTAPWFRWFLPHLTLPEGHPMRWEGHLLLMTEEFFQPSLVHLLVLIPKGNYKTTWEAALAVWHLLTAPAPRAFAAAADKGQTRELYDFAAHFADSEPEIAAKLITRPSTMEIRHASAPGRLALKVLAQDDSQQGGKKQGLNLTFGAADELHAWENRNLFTDLRSGGFKRREAARLAGDPHWHTLGKLATITTEGYSSESVLAEEVAKFLGNPEKGIPPKGTVETDLRVLPDGSVVHDPERGRLTIARYGNGRNVLLRWACREDDDTDDPEVVKLANPSSGATVESIEDARESLTPWEFLRYRCNIRTIGFTSWLKQGSWEALRADDVPVVEHRHWEHQTCQGAEPGQIPEPTEEFEDYIRSLYPPGAAIVGFVDMARYRDTAAVTTIMRERDDCPRCDSSGEVVEEEGDEQRRRTCSDCEGRGWLPGRKIPRTVVWRSGGQSDPIRYDWPKTAIRLLHRHYDLMAMGYDPKYFDQAAEELEGEGIAMELWPQSNERVCPADADLRREIVTEREFAHDGDPILAAHVIAGRAQDVGRDQFRIETQKGAEPPPIDACRALSGANALEKVTDPGGSDPMVAWG